MKENRTMTNLEKTLAHHAEWLADPEKGARADLRYADLRGVDLSGKDLSGAILYGADLRDACLHGTDCSDADMRQTDMLRANLSYADFTCTDGVIVPGKPYGWLVVAYQSRRGPVVRVNTCESTLAEARAQWAVEPLRQEMVAALDYVEAVAKLRGWEITT
jgi:hypothetical protein